MNFENAGAFIKLLHFLFVEMEQDRKNRTTFLYMLQFTWGNIHFV